MKNFSGVYTALITPFLNNKIDFESLEKLLFQQIKMGVFNFVVNGTTGESPNLDTAEIQEMFKFVKKTVGNKGLILLGTGSNSTKNTADNNKRAYDLGADAALVVVPYYNKPPQRGLIEHFKFVAAASPIPNILYNVPARTITSLNVETIVELAQIKNIVGIKEATGDIEFAKSLREKLPKQFILLSGDDGTYDRFLSVGGDGVISVASHLIGKLMVELFETRNKISQELQSKFDEHKKLIDLLFCEANPIPVKYAMYKLGVITADELRLPLVSLSKDGANQLITEMKRLGLI